MLIDYSSVKNIQRVVSVHTLLSCGGSLPWFWGPGDTRHVEKDSILLDIHKVLSHVQNIRHTDRQRERETEHEPWGP